MDAKDILPLVPDGQYDPSEVVLIGSHLDPSPSEEAISGTLAAVKAQAAADKKEVLLAGKDRDALGTGELRVRSDFADTLSLTASSEDEADAPTVALIYAYGFEGHYYRLSKPRIMIVEGMGSPYDPAAGDPAALIGQLFMWRVSKHTQTISIDVESGTIERLVLEANQPGNRAVHSYSAHMQMSHRGGKLS